MMTAEEAAALAKISVRKLYQWVEKGSLHFVERPDRFGSADVIDAETGAGESALAGSLKTRCRWNPRPDGHARHGKGPQDGGLRARGPRAWLRRAPLPQHRFAAPGCAGFFAT